MQCDPGQDDLDRRFGGLNRLHGAGARQFLTEQAHGIVVGVGGVGSWAAEGLARSGVGRLTLIDMDHVATSNINRQIQADNTTLGQSKIEALAHRIAQFYPECKVTLIDDFLTPENCRSLLEQSLTPGVWPVVLDCCDQVNAKVALAVVAKAAKIPVVLSGSAGGKSRPWLLQPADLRDTHNDPLLAKVRYTLRRNHGFPRDKAMGVPVFYSSEMVQRALGDAPQAGLNCAGYGSVVTVTATMGMHMAAWALNYWVQRLNKSPNKSSAFSILGATT